MFLYNVKGACYNQVLASQIYAKLWVSNKIAKIDFYSGNYSMYNARSLMDVSQVNKSENTLLESQTLFNQEVRDHRYCQAHELEMTRTETSSQIMYKCPHCNRSYIELKDTAGSSRKKRR